MLLAHRYDLIIVAKEGCVVLGGGADFPNVDRRFDFQPRHLFGPFWSLRVIDTETQRKIGAISGGLLTGFGSVKRQAHFGTLRYLRMTPKQKLRASTPM
jgi:hypothetical protein